MNSTGHVCPLELAGFERPTLRTTPMVKDYIVYHRCALCTPTCIVHLGAQGGPMSVRSGGRPRHFSFFAGSHGTCTFCLYLVGHKNGSKTSGMISVCLKGV